MCRILVSINELSQHSNINDGITQRSFVMEILDEKRFINTYYTFN